MSLALRAKEAKIQKLEDTINPIQERRGSESSQERIRDDEGNICKDPRKRKQTEGLCKTENLRETYLPREILYVNGCWLGPITDYRQRRRELAIPPTLC